MAKHSNTREVILDFAEQLFADRGFTATTISDIADQVGICGPGIYKHYANKLEIYEQVLERLFAPVSQLVDNLSASFARDDSQRGATAQLNILLIKHMSKPRMAKIIQHATLAGGDQLEIIVSRWYKPLFEKLHIASPELASGVMAFHSLTLGYATLAPLHAQIFDLDPLDEKYIHNQMKLHNQLADHYENMLSGAVQSNARGSLVSVK